MEGDEDPIIEISVNEYMEPYMEPAANQGEPHENNNNNPNRGGAMAEEDLLNKMEELRNAYDRLRAEKDQAAAEANRVAEAEAARRTEEAEYESDWDFHDPIASEIITFRGNTWPTGAGLASKTRQ